MKKKQKQSAGRLFYKIISVLVTALMIPTIILAMYTCFLMFRSQKQGTTPSIFGLSAVRVLTGSMINSGFNVNDVVLIKDVNKKSLKVGDVIAFYVYLGGIGQTSPLSYDEYITPENISSTPDLDIGWFFGEKNELTLKAGKVRASIWFHKIVDIRIDDYGKLWIKTWGTSNLDAYGEPIHDAFWVREDLVVGKYIPCPAFLTNIVSFLGSNIGVVLLVIVPLGIVLFMLTIQFVDDLDRYKMEKRIQKNLVKIDDKMCQSKEIGYDLSAKNKYRVLLREEDDAKKIQFVHCMWRPKDIPRPIIKHLRKQNWKNREEDKHNKTLAKLLEQYKKTQDPKIIEKYQQEKERFENESFRKPQTTLSNPQKELTDEEYLSMLSKDKLKQVLKIRKKERKSEIRYLKRSLEKEKKMLEKGEEISGVSDEEHIPTANDEEKVELSPVEEKVTTVHKKAQTSTGRKPSNVAKKRTTQTTKVETKASSGKSNAKSGQESRAKTLAAGSTPKKKPVTKTSETKSTGTKASNTKTTPVKAKSAMGKSNSATK